MASSPAETNATLLREILAELKKLNELMDSFTNEGFPLHQSVPNTEVLAGMIVAASLISRADPRVNPQDLNQRIGAAPIIANQLVQQLDAYLSQARLQSLESRAQA